MSRRREELEKKERQELITKFRHHQNDSGSPEVQVALLTHELGRLSEHLKRNTQDLHSMRGLNQKVSRRKNLLEYLKRTSPDKYKSTISALGIRK